MTAPDLRALVRARMAALGIDQVTLARRMAPRWTTPAGEPIAVDSAVRRLSRWLTGAGDMTSEPFAELLAELGGSLAWNASESSSDETEGAPAPTGSGLTCQEPT